MGFRSGSLLEAVKPESISLGLTVALVGALSVCLPGSRYPSRPAISLTWMSSGVYISESMLFLFCRFDFLLDKNEFEVERGNLAGEINGNAGLEKVFIGGILPKLGCLMGLIDDSDGEACLLRVNGSSFEDAAARFSATARAASAILGWESRNADTPLRSVLYGVSRALLLGDMFPLVGVL